ncbi:leucyl-tRNA synthetase [Plenodomus tracheiphilus IPT5]|uniref:leucine--tRNA ligase n=1 Tax=Plenodomus tracheiphilus IPT5 TaxID=1408161 RepID=A0A6A7BI60_9PLEO|nr:leucyl-tRNA synthetase [Plenodomus tracheiphilus IPT5]
MFPYPSGTLHLGHLRVYTISDVLARFKHMQGYKVLHPIGWDAFGLPAENAAIERGVHPEKWTLQNIEAMKAQMKLMGGRWDWDSELRTCDPDFYKHTQRIFLMLHERGLAYQAESLVNYDPVDKTVLANEQVDANGCSWRSGAKVEKVMLKQWFLKIKEFQEPLLKDLDALTQDGRWPEKVLAMQRNWIGKSEGTKLWFDIESTGSETQFAPVDVFTTRADTLFGVQYIALSLHHPIVQQLAVEDENLRSFIERAKDLPPDTKEGYRLESVVARNPIAHVVKTEDASTPVYVAPYVLDDYGSGAVMGVPGHDTRDHAFWRTNEGDRPIKSVIASKRGESPTSLVPGSEDVPVTFRGFVAADIERFGGMQSKKAAEEIVKSLRSRGKPAEMTSNWRLRDWLISRQRYWGAPIPIIHCDSCGPVAVPEEDLPVKLPDLPDSFFQGRKGNPLAEDKTWKHTTCPKCGSAAERETDTMDTFMDSSWYFFRFLDSKNETAIVDPSKANNGMPVDLYVGGVEHAILHLLYSRFISKFLATTSVWPQGDSVNGEPFKRLITQGMVHGETYTDPQTGRFLRSDEVDLSDRLKPTIKSSGIIPNRSYEKMSKSKYNGVDPSAIITKYGADATRAHMLFQAPVSDVLEWDETKITGVERWLQRVIRLSTAFWIPVLEMKNFRLPTEVDMPIPTILQDLVTRGILKNAEMSGTLGAPQHYAINLAIPEAQLWIKTQEIILSVTEAYSQTYSLNTIVSDLMTLTNNIWDTPHASRATPYLKWHATARLIRMLAPVAPGVAEEAWYNLHNITGCAYAINTNHAKTITTVFASGFPVADTDTLSDLTQTRTCVVQVDGKRKFQVDIAKLPVALSARVGKTSGARERVDQFVLEELLRTELGKEWFGRETGKIWKMDGGEGERKEGKVYAGGLLLPEGWRVVVVGNGKLVNFVGPRKRVEGRAGEKLVGGGDGNV